MRPILVANLYRNTVAIAVIGVISIVGVGCDGSGTGPASIRNEIGMTFVPAGPDTFWMGADAREFAHMPDERQHRVTLSCDFLLSTTEVTQGQWNALMPKNPSIFRGDKLPVESISWQQATEFCNRLSKAAGLDPVYDPTFQWDPGADGYRLPTEAEWEYAARAETTGPFHTGSQLTGEDANFILKHPYGTFIGLTSLHRTVPVGSYEPNDWGLYDVHGNVWEWCWDVQGRYPLGAVTDPVGRPPPPEDRLGTRTARGGGWSSPLGMCRSAERRFPHHAESTRRANEADEPGREGGADIGLRLARNITIAARGPGFVQAGKTAMGQLERSLGIEMVRIPAGSFVMGSPPKEVGREFNRARHPVSITRRFWVATTEVTRGQWRSVMSKEVYPKTRPDDALPFTSVSWFDAIEFCNVLSIREGLMPAYDLAPAAEGHPASATWHQEANGYRLPTEAEWQLAAGPNEPPPLDSDSTEWTRSPTAWFRDNSGSGSRAVGQFPPTGVGIHDARGNVWEWCWDWYGPYPNSTTIDPTGPRSGLARVKRGGSWGSPHESDMFRGGYDPNVDLNSYLGFRVVRNMD